MNPFKRYLVQLTFIALVLGVPASIATAWETRDPSTAAPTAETATGKAVPANTDYKINPGDILSVAVWREEELKQDVLVRPDGKISFPLAGDIQAAGNSVAEVRDLLTERLEKLIPDAVVSVTILQINGNKVFVIGQVFKPGEINANPYLDVMQALSIAGGANAFADVNNIAILRRTNTGQISIPFDYSEVAEGDELEQNIILQAGDVVVVP